MVKKRHAWLRQTCVGAHRSCVLRVVKGIFCGKLKVHLDDTGFEGVKDLWRTGDATGMALCGRTGVPEESPGEGAGGSVSWVEQETLAFRRFGAME